MKVDDEDADYDHNPRSLVSSLGVNCWAGCPNNIWDEHADTAPYEKRSAAELINEEGGH